MRSYDATRGSSSSMVRGQRATEDFRCPITHPAGVYFVGLSYIPGGLPVVTGGGVALLFLIWRN